jgi:hypothetical protein
MRTSQDGRPPVTAFEIFRDGQGPLQFNGWQLAEVESTASPMTHRVALYETKGGKFVSQFSIRPSSPKPHEIRRLKLKMIDTVAELATAYLKLAEFGEDNDPRIGIGDALQSLVAELDDLPDNAPEWARLWLVFKGDGHDEGIAPEQTSTLKDFGKRGQRPRNGAEALSDLTDELAARKRIDIASKRTTNKVAVHATLDEALASFKPGALTAKLLDKLGRLEPEFIE